MEKKENGNIERQPGTRIKTRNCTPGAGWGEGEKIKPNNGGVRGERDEKERRETYFSVGMCQTPSTRITAGKPKTFLNGLPWGRSKDKRDENSARHQHE